MKIVSQLVRPLFSLLVWAWLGWGFTAPLTEGVFHHHLATIQLYRGDEQLTPPTLNLNETGFLTLAFDWLDPSAPPSLELHFRHCTKNWEEDDLQPVEFYTGTYPIPIIQYKASVSTYKPYLHYEIQFPQPGARFKYSGNYVVELVEKEKGKVLLRKRFLVVERMVAIQSSFTEARGQQARTFFQQLEFSIDVNRLPVSFIEQEIEVHILQNWNWNLERIMKRPTFLRGNEIQYQLDPNALFPGGNEFRLLDIRSFQAPKQNFSYYLSDSGYVIRYDDKLRSRSPYFAINDLNGKFYVITQDIGDPEYIYVIIGLQTEKFWDGEVYLIGELSLWGQNDRYRMKYDYNLQAYLFQGWLKQGVYNYIYGIQTDRGWDLIRIEGSHYETENEYTILVYYTRFGERVHRLVGIQQIHSRSN